MEFQFLTFQISAYFAISLTIRPKYYQSVVIRDKYSNCFRLLQWDQSAEKDAIYIEKDL